MKMTEQINLSKLRKQLESREVFCVAWGLIFHIICAPHDMPVEEMMEQTNRLYPTGIASKWVLANPPPKEGAWRDTNTLPCPDCAKRFHYLLNC